ncbi:tetratricopeptide repeat protein [Hazenella sp. IB182357]|uniref:Tetratricopeptide repeat protein n=1 Tax=Polycladospora coralii TaxID=2771432 RepID=A0A926N7D3_9BACL|nr:tetratricopeptide repeat protein [Polycladospora coralii]MBD1373271.1 tetratricopeptide repeat protein [Polycladospora coralii]MBS7528885.1 tetratricopeptide repeat protein [Polycladospora coralii]
MYLQQWLDLCQNALGEIRTGYPQSPEMETKKWRNRLLQVKESCDLMLKSWAVIEEEIAHLLQEFPDLNPQEEEIDEEFWLNESLLRQFRQGQGYYDLTMFHEAADMFKGITEREPDFLLGRLYMGLTLFQNNAFTQAKEHFNWVCQNAKHPAFIGFGHLLLGCCAVRLQQEEQALESFSQAIAQLPEQADAWFNLGASHFRQKAFQDAIPYFYHALSLKEDDWESMYYIACCYRELGDWNSQSFWRLAAFEKSNHPHMMEAIAYDYEEMHQPTEAIYWYQRLQMNHPRNPVAYHGLAWNYWVMGEYERSSLWLKKGLSLFPSNTNLLYMYAWMCLIEKDFVKAEHTLQMIPKNKHSSSILTAVRSRYWEQVGDYEVALQTANQLLNQPDKEVRALGHFQKGRIWLDQGQVKQALTQFQTAREISTKWKDPLFFEGLCYLMEGKTERSQSCWNQLSDS